MTDTTDNTPDEPTETSATDNPTSAGDPTAPAAEATEAAAESAPADVAAEPPAVQADEAGEGGEAVEPTAATPTEQPAEEAAAEPAEPAAAAPTQEPLEQPAAAPAEEAAEPAAAQAPATEQPAQQTAEAAPAEVPAEGAEAPAEVPAEPAEQPAEAPAEVPAEQPAEAPAEAAAGPVEQPAETAAEEPAAAQAPATEQPAQETAEAAPAEVPAEPAEQPAEAPAAEAPLPDGPLPKPGEEGYDPDHGLGLVETTTVLGPPNMGGFDSGEIVTGTILTVTRREAEVDLGNGKIGVIGDRHWSSATQVDMTSVVKPGDSVEAAVLARADMKKRITLSHLWAQQKRGWETVESAAKDKSVVTATVTDSVKSGLSLDVHGVRGFMPASLVDVSTVNDLAPFVGQTFEVRVIEADRTKQRLIVSRKAALRASQRQQAREALAGFEVGQTLTGKVAQITDFGAFVDVAGVRGLVHKSEIGWTRARDPQRDLKVGQEVEVRVLKVQPSRNRLGLSMKSGTDPLADIKRGDRYEGTVSRLVDFGAFVALPAGVEGLVHVSEMAEYRVFAPEEIVIPGEKVWVKVLKVDKKRRTVDLSMAQAIVPDPPEEAAAAAEAEAEAPAAAETPAGEAVEAPVDDDYAEDQLVEAANDADEQE